MTEQPFTPDTVPPDTDRYIYRPVVVFDDIGTGVPVVSSQYRQIWISQP